MVSSVISWLSGKAKTYLAVAGALVLAFAYAFLKGRASGVKTSTDSITRETQRVNEKFHEIESTRPDFDASLNSLRQRAKQGSGRK